MSRSGNKVEQKAAVKNGVLRLVLIAISLGVQIALVIFAALRANAYIEWFNILMRLLAILLALGIYSQPRTSAMKMTWLVLIGISPVVGVVLYLLVGLNRSIKRMRHRYEEIDKGLFPLIPQEDEPFQALEQQDPLIANLSRYIGTHAHYPVYQGTKVTYFAEASDGLAAQLEDLRKAEHFIFLFYYAIEDAEAFHMVEDVLVERVKAGVEVRIFYDDIGSITFIDTDFVKRMESRGFQCRVFNPFAPVLNLFLNNRDHQKITVIDGKIGYTGGYNLANEYFNLTQPYGYWKDTGVRLEGEAVRSFTVTCLEMWNAEKRGEPDRDYTPYLPHITAPEGVEGFVQPYADTPIDNECVGENVYISLIERAQRYVWFTTPYLIITDEMIHALNLAAKRGVDVRIITPGIPDKKTVFSVTRSYYHCLTVNGVRIYEYTPGFCHAKMCISDDKVATCGTINLDFRSLYHHFENGVLYYGCQAVLDTKADFERTMAQSQEVTEQYTSGRSAGMRFSQLILRLISPML
ncbi:MAG: cardiolipin synthase [Oscillospiraceae bacterium]|nr:cardiolipin synthase [Oscillospiraceae bacterium]